MSIGIELMFAQNGGSARLSGGASRLRRAMEAAWVRVVSRRSVPVTRRSPAVVLSGCRCWLRLGQCSGANRAVKCRSCRGWDTMRMPGSWAARLATRVTTSIT